MIIVRRLTPRVISSYSKLYREKKKSCEILFIIIYDNLCFLSGIPTVKMFLRTKKSGVFFGQVFKLLGIRTSFIAAPCTEVAMLHLLQVHARSVPAKHAR